MPQTRWGQAIARLLAERNWSQKDLARAAKVRPNTLTNIIKHGRDSDTGTIARIAEALKVDIAELFLTNRQSLILRAYRENRVEQLKNAVMKELSETVTRLVRTEFERTGELNLEDTPAGGEPSAGPKARRRRGRTSSGTSR
jgi:transcriptional regulator with XRE-family HTH domain